MIPEWFQRFFDFVCQPDRLREQPLKFRPERMIRIGLIVHAVAALLPPQNARLRQRRGFTLKTGRRHTQVLRQVTQVPALFRPQQKGRENVLPDAREERIQYRVLTHNAYAITQFA